MSVNVRHRIVLVVAAALFLAVPTSCADDSGDMTGEATFELATAVQTVRDRIESDDLFGAAGELGELRTTVATLVSTGAITSERGERILDSIEVLEGELVASLQASTTTTVPPTTTTTTVAPTTAPPTTTTTTTTTTQPADDPSGRDKDKEKDDD